MGELGMGWGKWTVCWLMLICLYTMPIKEITADELEKTTDADEQVVSLTESSSEVPLLNVAEQSHSSSELKNDEIINAETSDETVDKVESSAEKTISSSETKNQLIPFALIGEGTVTNPYTAGTVGELKDVLTAIKNDVGTGTYYLNLTENIVYSGADVFEIYKSIEINGQGNYMLYENSSSTTEANVGYRIKVSGLQVKIKNLNFGSSTLTDDKGNVYGNQSYYGIIGAGGSSAIQFDATLENVNYYGKTGAQPLLTWNTESTFTMMGENHFKSEVGSNSQEFMEGYNLFFAKGSKTTIDHQTSASSSLLYGYGTGGSGDRKMRVTLEEDAEVDFTSSKTYFTYGSNGLILTIGKGAEFFYTQTDNKALTFTNTSSASAEINAQKDSQMTVLSGGRITSSGAITMNVNEPNWLRFKNTATTGLFNKNVTFNRLDGNVGEIGGYQFNYLSASQELLKKEVAGASTLTLADNYFENPSLKQAIYQKKIKIIDWESFSDVDVGRSNLITTIKDYDPSERTLTNNTFKLSKERLWTGDEIKNETAQQEIEDATDETQGMVTSETSASSTWHVEELISGSYYVYVKISGTINEDPELQIFASESLWVEKEVEIAKSPLSVEVPLELLFQVREVGAFDTKESAQPILSESNYPIDFTIDSVQDLSVESPITLVDQVTAGESNQLRLQLAATNDTILGPLIVGENTVDSLTIAPFLTEPLGIYLKGEYSGPIFKKYDTNYTFTYSLTPQGESK